MFAPNENKRKKKEYSFVKVSACVAFIFFFVDHYMPRGMSNSPPASPSLKEGRAYGCTSGLKKKSRFQSNKRYQEVSYVYSKQEKTEKAFSLLSSKATCNSNHTLFFFCKLYFLLILCFFPYTDEPIMSQSVFISQFVSEHSLRRKTAESNRQPATGVDVSNVFKRAVIVTKTGGVANQVSLTYV